MAAEAADRPETGRGTGRVRRSYRESLPGVLAVPAVLFLLAFFLLPLVENAVGNSGGAQGGLDAYKRILGDPFYLGIVADTIVLSVVVSLACLIFGYPIAYFLVRHAGRWSGLIIFLLMAPLLTSIVMRTFGWRVLFARTGLVNVTLSDLGLIDRPLQLLNNPFAVVIGLVHVLIPFMVLSIAATLRGVNRNLEDSARILGARSLTTFLRVTLPLTLDGVATGTILVFMLTNGSFVTVLLLGGGSVQTAPLLIYQEFLGVSDLTLATAFSTVLLVIAVACLYLQLRFIRKPGARPT